MPDTPPKQKTEVAGESSADVQPVPAKTRVVSGPPGPDQTALPAIPEHQLLRCIGRGSYGEVWLARNIMGTYRAVKVVYRASFRDLRPFEREFAGLKSFDPISRTHP